MKPEISIIVPVYNVEKYLSRCIESILKQTYQDYELIIINDGSPDNCDKIIEEYAQQDSRIVTICQDNQGLSAARNAGIAIAQGNYYMFVDSDDIIYPNCLSKLVMALEKNDADVSICGMIEFEEEIGGIVQKNFEGIRVYDGRSACEKIYDSNRNQASYVSACAKLYKKDFFSECKFPVGKIHEDQFVAYKILYNSSKVVEIGECLYGCYKNMQSITRSSFNIKRYDDIEALEEAETFFENHNEYDLLIKARKRKQELLAEYLIKARNVKIQHLVPEKYKMSFWKAKKILLRYGGIDRYEYVMYQFYPKLIIFEARLRKIKRVMTRKDVWKK